MIGRNIGDYRILARFDLGESGAVFKSVHTTQRQTFLLKLLRANSIVPSRCITSSSKTFS